MKEEPMALEETHAVHTETAPPETASLPASGKMAVLYRMATAEHTCPYGLKALDLLKREGYAVDDRKLLTRAEIDAFKAKHDVKTTPQTFISGKPIGGYEDLVRYLGRTPRDKTALTYKPVIAIFAMAALLAIAASWAAFGAISLLPTVEWFIAIAMSLLALQKLRDVESFATMFLGYDLLAQRWVRYAYFYPFAEAAAGLLMLAGALMWLSIPLALFIGTVGAASVFKAVYIDRRELKCACVGGDSNVPLGLISLTENLMMIGMSLWMIAKPFVLIH